MNPNFGRFFQNQQMPAQRAIINFSKINTINETSFINSSLQALGSTKYMFMWVSQWTNNVYQLNMNPRYALTKEIVNLFYTLNQSRIPDSSNFILRYLNEVRSYTNLTVNNPIEFFYYLFQIIHKENNYPMNPNQNMNSLKNLTLAQKVNDNFMRNFFLSLLSQTHNSIISQNFFTILKKEVRCNFCSIKYSYEYKYMIKFKINEYLNYRNACKPERANYKLTLDECFECYTGGYPCKCDTCTYSMNAQVFTSIYSLPNVLIIALIRNSHKYFGDLDFRNNLSLNGFCVQGMYKNNNYYLKACVSLNNKGESFTDIQTSNNIWYRYYGNQVSRLNNVNYDLKAFEPQLLIYES